MFFSFGHKTKYSLEGIAWLNISFFMDLLCLCDMGGSVEVYNYHTIFPYTVNNTLLPVTVFPYLDSHRLACLSVLFLGAGSRKREGVGSTRLAQGSLGRKNCFKSRVFWNNLWNNGIINYSKTIADNMNGILGLHYICIMLFKRGSSGAARAAKSLRWRV